MEGPTGQQSNMYVVKRGGRQEVVHFDDHDADQEARARPQRGPLQHGARQVYADIYPGITTF